MARVARKTKAVKEVVNNDVNIMDEIITDEEPKDTEEVVEVKKEKRKFDPEELITCTSSSVGRTYVYGEKSGETYGFEAQGVEVGIEYRDLVAMVNSKSAFLFKPFIIVKDDDFVNAFPKLKDFYEKTWTRKDINSVLRLPPKEMIDTLAKMPVGIQKSLQEIVATKIANGTMDSVSRIKALDDYFGTQLMLLTGLVD